MAARADVLQFAPPLLRLAAALAVLANRPAQIVFRSLDALAAMRCYRLQRRQAGEQKEERQGACNTGLTHNLRHDASSGPEKTLAFYCSSGYLVLGIWY